MGNTDPNQDPSCPQYVWDNKKQNKYFDRSMLVTYEVDVNTHSGATPIQSVNLIPFAFYKTGAPGHNQFYEGPGEQYVTALNQSESDPSSDAFQIPVQVLSTPISLRPTGPNSFSGTFSVYIVNRVRT